MNSQVIELTTFDYMAPEHRDYYTCLTHARDIIRNEMGKCAKSIITIGLNLIDAKNECGHGLFLKWLAAEFGWSADTAQRFMQVAKVFSDSARVRFLEPTTLYLLAAPSTPEEVREEVLSRFDAGERLPAKEVRSLIKEAKPKRPPKPSPPQPVTPADHTEPERGDVRDPAEQSEQTVAEPAKQVTLQEPKGEPLPAAMTEWTATFRSWSRPHQEVALRLLEVDEESIAEVREHDDLLELRELTIIALEEDVGRLELENRSLQDRLASLLDQKPEPDQRREPEQASPVLSEVVEVPEQGAPEVIEQAAPEQREPESEGSLSELDQVALLIFQERAAAGGSRWIGFSEQEVLGIDDDAIDRLEAAGRIVPSPGNSRAFGIPVEEPARVGETTTA